MKKNQTLIIIVVIVFVIAIAAGVFFYLRKKKTSEEPDDLGNALKSASPSSSNSSLSSYKYSSTSYPSLAIISEKFPLSRITGTTKVRAEFELAWILSKNTAEQLWQEYIAWVEKWGGYSKTYEDFIAEKIQFTVNDKIAKGIY